MIKTLVTNREWGKFSHTQVASAVKACLGRTEVAKRLLFIAFAVVASFAGQTAYAQVEPTKAPWKGSSPSEANGKTVYLYNVGTKQFLGKGGRWGTEATMNVEGVPFTLTYSSGTFTLTSKVKKEGGESTTPGKLTLMDGKISGHDKGNYFVDQPGSSFTAMQQDNGYVITSNVTSSGSTMYDKTYKVVAFGEYQKAYAKLSTADWEKGDSTAYATWIIVTEQERKDAFKTVNNAHVAAVNATFLMYDFDFARNDNTCAEWKTGATATGGTPGTLSYAGNEDCKPEDAIPTTYTYTSSHVYEKTIFGTHSHTSTIVTTEDHGDTWVTECNKSEEHDTGYPTTVTYTKTTPSYTYYLGNGYADGDIQASYGGAWTANIHGPRGTVVQTIPNANMIKEGWYRVSCVGFTTTTKGIARLFAAAGKGNTDHSTAQSEKFGIADLAKIDATNKPATYVDASNLLATPGVSTYDASVKVYVSKKDDGSFETLSFGIQVGSAADATQDADADAWTCFDNFKLEYLGTPPNELILDEEQTDGGYINAQAADANKTLQKSVVYLHRTMNPGKWNSLVLPIDLTVGQVKSSFGDQVRISEFYGAREDHPQRIVFDPVKVDRNDASAIAIKAGELYLVKPTTDGGMPTGQTEKTFNYNGKTISVTDYYTIVGVTFKQKKDVEGIDYNARVEDTTGSEEHGTEKYVQHVGTYVKCFDTNNIPANSYVLNGNNVGGTAGLWYYRTVTTNTKGFRGWLQSVDGLPSKGFEYEIEGVVDQVNGDATAIEGIEAAQQHNANIYNLNGQLVRQGATSTEGLPSGLYIVGGKKVVVK